MRHLSAPAIAALSGPVVRMVQLVYLGFAVPITLNTSNYDLVYAGLTFKGAGGLGTISQIEDSPGEIKGLSFELSGVDSAHLALALDDAAVVQGTPVHIRLALLDENLQVVDAPLDWLGTLDTMTIVEDGEKCTIQVTAESSAVDLLRGAALTNSDADQKALHPGDRAFEFIVSEANAPVVWPSKQWFIANSGH